MKVLMVSDEELNGGAAISASNLANGMAEAGIEVSRLVMFSPLAGNNGWRTIKFWPGNSFAQKVFARIIPVLPKGVKVFFSNKKFDKILAAERPDAVNFHNILWGINRGYNLDMYTVAAKKAVTFITMHDMWNIIGYPYNLDTIKDKHVLDNWEVPQEHLNGNTKEEVASLRQSVFNNENIFFISPSNWLKEELIKNFPFTEKRIFVIPYGVDTDVFKPEGTRAERQYPANKINILASAASLDHVNKGFHILINTLRQRNNADIRLLLMGNGDIVKETALPPDLEIVSFGYVSDKKEKAKIYNESDIFAFPSFADNLPNSVIESIACGTPVIAFNTCGLPDLVKEQKTGWLSDEVSLNSYAKTFERAVEDFKNGIDMTASCRDFVLENFKIDRQAKEYAKIFYEKRIA